MNTPSVASRPAWVGSSVRSRRIGILGHVYQLPCSTDKAVAALAGKWPLLTLPTSHHGVLARTGRVEMLLLAAATLSFGRSALLRPPTPLLRHRAPVCTVSEAAPETDLVGDGGVLKRVLQAGNGESPVKGTTVEVHYDGTLLSTGARFDSSRERGKVRSRAAGPAPHHCHRRHHHHHHHHHHHPQTFKFTLGEGKVIGGWEVGVASMKPGELSVLTCSPSYA